MVPNSKEIDNILIHERRFLLYERHFLIIKITPLTIYPNKEAKF